MSGFALLLPGALAPSGPVLQEGAGQLPPWQHRRSLSVPEARPSGRPAAIVNQPAAACPRGGFEARPAPGGNRARL